MAPHLYIKELQLRLDLTRSSALDTGGFSFSSHHHIFLSSLKLFFKLLFFLCDMFRWCALILVILLSLNGPVDARVRTTADAIIVEGNLDSFLCIYYEFQFENAQKKEKTRIFFDEKVEIKSLFDEKWAKDSPNLML